MYHSFPEDIRIPSILFTSMLLVMLPTMSNFASYFPTLQEAHCCTLLYFPCYVPDVVSPQVGVLYAGHSHDLHLQGHFDPLFNLHIVLGMADIVFVQLATYGNISIT